MKYVLLDASVLVALFNVNEVHHNLYREKIRTAQSESTYMVSTWPCVTEASYHLSRTGHIVMLKWLAASVMIDEMTVADLPQIVDYMERYTEPRKILMDFADASLVLLAIKLDCNKILTEDRRDFLRYRLPDGRGFEVI
jgi:uncharacterized protein